MITNKRNFFIGIFLLIIPLLGFPLAFKFFFIYVIAGILIVSSAKMVMPKNFPKQFSRKQFFKERIDEWQGEKMEEVVKSIMVEKPMVDSVVHPTVVPSQPLHHTYAPHVSVEPSVPHHAHQKHVKEKIVVHKKAHKEKEVPPSAPVKKTRLRKAKGVDSIQLQ